MQRQQRSGGVLVAGKSAHRPRVMVKLCRAEQSRWANIHPGAETNDLCEHLRREVGHGCIAG